MHTDIICGLDIGASSIRALIAEPISEKILGYAECPTNGFSKGVVSNLTMLSDTIEETVSKAEGIACRKVRKVITNISGMHIRQFKSRGCIHISDRPSEITNDAIKRCIESAKVIAMSLDREVVHLVPERFYIDDKMEINDPLGLFGSKLNVDLNIITTLVSVVQNLTKAINLAGYEVEDAIVSGAGTGLSIFDHKQLEEGALVIDVGKDITEASLWTEGKLKECFYFPFGSDDFTQVLQDKLRIMFEKAEELKIKYGVVTKDDFSVQDAVSRREISNLLFQRVEQIMQDVYKQIEPFLRERKRVPHIRIVGGAGKMDGFIEAVEEIFGMPVEMGTIRGVQDLSRANKEGAIALNDVTFACCMGIVSYGAQKRAEKKPKFSSHTNNVVGKVISRIRSVGAEYF